MMMSNFFSLEFLQNFGSPTSRQDHCHTFPTSQTKTSAQDYKYERNLKLLCPQVGPVQ